MLVLSDKWAPELIAQGETGMGYQIASVVLKDGKRFNQVVIVGGIIGQIKDIEGSEHADSLADAAPEGRSAANCCLDLLLAGNETNSGDYLP